MNKLINKILTEWAYKVNDGMPDVNNSLHMVQLERSLNDLEFPEEFIVEFMQNLREVDTDRKKLMKKIIKYKDKEGNEKEATVGGIIKQGEDHPGYKKAKSMVDEPKKEKPKEPRDKEATKDFFKSTYEKDAEKEKDDKKDDTKEKKSGNKGELTKVEGEDSEIKQKALDNGYKKGTEWTAPGGPGSMFNEIMSGEGVHILDENPDMTEEELARQMFEQSKDTALGQQQAKSSIPVDQIPDDLKENLKKAKESGDKKAIKKAEQDIAVYSKCIITARAAKQKKIRKDEGVVECQKQGKFGEPQKTMNYFGSSESIKKQEEAVDAAVKKGGKILLEDGTEVDSEDMKDFIRAGGGGANPSDTAMFVEDDDGNLMITFTSDKMSTSDIQDNSTLAKQNENYDNSIDKNPDLSPEQKEKSKSIVKKHSDKMADLETQYAKVTQPAATAMKKDDVGKVIETMSTQKDTKEKFNDVKTSLDKGKKSPYYKHLPEGYSTPPTDEDVAQAIMNRVEADGGTADDRKVIQRTAKTRKESMGDDAPLEYDLQKKVGSIREQVVKTQRQIINELNEIEPRLGTEIEAESVSKGFHLKLMDDAPYEKGKPDTLLRSVRVNMGGVIVDGKILRHCTGVKNTQEFKKKMELEETEELTYDSNKKDADGKPLGNVTGKKVYTYVTDSDGVRRSIGFKTYRPKSGKTGKTDNTLQYSKEFQDCLKGETAKRS